MSTPCLNLCAVLSLTYERSRISFPHRDRGCGEYESRHSWKVSPDDPRQALGLLAELGASIPLR